MLSDTLGTREVDRVGQPAPPVSLLPSARAVVPGGRADQPQRPRGDITTTGLAVSHNPSRRPSAAFAADLDKHGLHRNA